MRRRAFTIIEILVVIGIIAILAGLLFPVFARVRRSAMQADSISNLRQCGVAIAIYLEGDDLRNLPNYESAKIALTKAPTCDRADYLRTNCAADYGPPLIGSYGYVRGVDTWSNEDTWQQALDRYPNPYLFASVYYGERKVIPFDGNDHNPCVGDMSCAWPSRLLRVKADTSVTVSNFGAPKHSAKGGTYLLFTWGPIFYTDRQGK
jgi:prepilin-type N-terminal cleavage/methylation domain-containing protein